MLKRLKNIVERIFDFIESFLDTLSAIPIIGPLLTFVVVMFVIGLIAALVIMTAVGIFSINYKLGFTIILIGMNVVTYLASFKWGMRKPWFFVMGLILSLIAFFAILFAD